jgi:hypothetical protein
MADKKANFKRLAGLLALALVPLALAGTIASFITTKDLTDLATNPLPQVQRLAVTRLKNQFERLTALVAAQASRREVIALFDKIAAPSPAGQKAAVAVLKPALNQIVPGSEGYRFVLLGPSGTAGYATGPRPAQVLKLAAVKTAVLARAFERARKAKPGQSVIQDFGLTPSPDGAEAAAVVAAPVFKQKKALGVLALLVPARALAPALSWQVGAIRVYAVGADHVVRPWLKMPSHLDDSIWRGKRELIQQKKIKAGPLWTGQTLAVPGQAAGIKTPRLDSPAITRALDGRDGRGLIADGPGGVRVISAFGPLDVAGLKWAVIAEKDYNLVMGPPSRLRRVFISWGVFVVVIFVIWALLSLASARLPILAEFWEFLRYRKKYWLLPIVLVLLGIGLLLVVAGGAGPMTPFIYALF